MAEKNKSAQEMGVSTGAQKISTNNDYTRIDPDSKIGRVLKHLIAGNRLHRFQAEKVCRDHVLPSTVSGLQRKYGLIISREMVTVRGYRGAPTQVAEYWLDSDQQGKAK